MSPFLSDSLALALGKQNAAIPKDLLSRLPEPVRPKIDPDFPGSSDPEAPLDQFRTFALQQFEKFPVFIYSLEDTALFLADYCHLVEALSGLPSLFALSTEQSEDCFHHLTSFKRNSFS
jgi:hypothetical protein